MTRIRCYCLDERTRSEDRLAAQQRAIREYISRHAGAVPGGAASELVWYVDPEWEGVHALSLRPAGRRLLADARPGDIVVAARLDRLVWDSKDLMTTVDLLRHIQVILFICECGLVNFASDTGRGIVSMMALWDQLQRHRASARTRLTNLKRKTEGLSNLGPPHYGSRHKVVIRKGKKVKIAVPDPEERALMRRMLVWVEQGLSLERIKAMLNGGNGGDTAPGHPNLDKRYGTPIARPWSKEKIRRMIQAEKRLQLKERIEMAVRAPRSGHAHPS